MNLKKEDVLIVQAKLLGGWICVDERLPEDEALDKIMERMRNPKSIISPPTSDKELLRDRLFGGFECAEDTNRRHIYFAQAHYTFIHPESNVPMAIEDRAKVWEELKDNNKWIGGINFVEKEMQNE